MSLSRLVYVSTANPELMLSDLDAILDTARARNEVAGLTGLLLFNGFNFMQLLEGPPAGLDPVFASICRDLRHSGVVRVFSGTGETRVFPDWAMGYARTGSGDGAAALTTTADALKAFLPGDLSPELHTLFVSFNTMSAFDGHRPAGEDPRHAP
jgi:hypothetical protein